MDLDAQWSRSMWISARRTADRCGESPVMHPELRRARTLYQEWRWLPERERARIAPFAREVKELALDLRGHADADAPAAARELADANAALQAILRNTLVQRAA